MDEGPAYPIPLIPMDTNGYVYHTYTMEWFPHECEILIDGIVVSRFPDRMIPVGDIRYDYMSTYPRVPEGMYIGELDIDGGPGYATYGPYATEKAFFQSNVATAPGCWNNAAHDLIDYVKIWDLPAGYSVPPIKP